MDVISWAADSSPLSSLEIAVDVSAVVGDEVIASSGEVLSVSPAKQRAHKYQRQSHGEHAHFAPGTSKRQFTNSAYGLSQTQPGRTVAEHAKSSARQSLTEAFNTGFTPVRRKKADSRFPDRPEVNNQQRQRDHINECAGRCKKAVGQ